MNNPRFRLLLLAPFFYLGCLFQATAKEPEQYVYGRKKWRVSMQVVQTQQPTARQWAAEDLWREPPVGLLVLSESHDTGDGSEALFEALNPWFDFHGRQVFTEMVKLDTTRQNGQWVTAVETSLMLTRDDSQKIDDVLINPKWPTMRTHGDKTEQVRLKEIARIKAPEGASSQELIEALSSPANQLQQLQTPFDFGVTYVSKMESDPLANQLVFWRIDELPGKRTWDNEKALPEKSAWPRLTAWDTETQTLYLVESDGQTITALQFASLDPTDLEAKVLWSINPREALDLYSYRFPNPQMRYLGVKGDDVRWTYANSQFGELDKRTGEAEWHGQD